ncbi:MAG: DinB family protein [Bacteroidetes bacterium]|nr:DinB family protein [Bacteroidota bacterium]
MYSLTKHLGYTVWATTKLSQILEKADESLLKKETPSSFNTIEKTILHIWDADLVWLKRLQGESLLEWPSKDFKGDKGALLAGWLQNTIDLNNHVASKTPEYLQSQINYKNMAGKPYSNTIEEIIYHVVNHGTFHRGQIVTMMRKHGWTELPINEELTSTDLITYLRETK